MVNNFRFFQIGPPSLGPSQLVPTLAPRPSHADCSQIAGPISMELRGGNVLLPVAPRPAIRATMRPRPAELGNRQTPVCPLAPQAPPPISAGPSSDLKNRPSSDTFRNTDEIAREQRK